MSTAKLKIDLTQGIIDVEGSDSFVLAVYNDFKEKFDHGSVKLKPIHNPLPSPSPQGGVVTGRKKSNGIQSKTRKKSGSQTPSLLKDLDLSGGKKCESLKDFFGLYEAKTNFERNLIFVYYLKQKLALTNITVDHVFSCYRDVPGIKSPEALRQSLIDTNNRRGWVDTSNTDDIKVTITGVNYLEHDLPKKTN